MLILFSFLKDDTKSFVSLYRIYYSYDLEKPLSSLIHEEEIQDKIQMATAPSSFESKDDQREEFREDINVRCSNEEVQLGYGCEEAIHLNSYTRLERFCYPEKMIFQTFQTRKRGFLLIDRWQSRHENILNDCLAIAELAAQGMNLTSFLQFGSEN